MMDKAIIISRPPLALLLIIPPSRPSKSCRSVPILHLFFCHLSPHPPLPLNPKYLLDPEKHAVRKKASVIDMCVCATFYFGRLVGPDILVKE